MLFAVFRLLALLLMVLAALPVAVLVAVSVLLREQLVPGPASLVELASPAVVWGQKRSWRWGGLGFLRGGERLLRPSRRPFSSPLGIGVRSFL